MNTTLNKYYNFLESIRTEDSQKLITAVLEAAYIIFEQDETTPAPEPEPAPEPAKESTKKADPNAIPEESEFRMLAPTFAEQLIEWKEGAANMIPTIDEFLETNPDDQEAKKFKKYLEDIRKNASRLTGYISRISEMQGVSEPLPEALPEELPVDEIPMDDAQLGALPEEPPVEELPPQQATM